MIEPLLSRDINSMQMRHLRAASSVDIATYNVHIPFLAPFLTTCPKTRLLVGAPEVAGERQATITSSILATASRYPRVSTRVLLGSHVKLMVFYLPGRRIRAIIGSQNLGQGHPFELAVEIRGEDAEKLGRIYQRLWVAAEQVKPLDMSQVKAKLASGVFET